ncbi:acyl-CoA dehydrogenase family protein [Homoserinimonas sp. OAct 916]|uniref:acyl-CoA dehydrogenase family protein n=1 Tax=Homoserinimonas sp. OAct 916 TaxID=2211450 RepID=UPI000DBE6100|nr:acyl-CoA dehydrogenase family protein [Homoserinimonas sp. OAct 916]
MSTRSVSNQSPPRIDVNEFTSNRPLVEGVGHYDAGWSVEQLTQIGAHVATAEFQAASKAADRNEPELVAFDPYGNRIDEVHYHPAYHEIIASAVSYGVHTSAWAEPGPGANVARAAGFMLFAQIEPGHACPISMTHSAVPTLQLQPDLADEWLPRVLSRGYDSALAAPSGKPGALFGMGMTEKQGGSDVRANTTRAVHRGANEYVLTGHKWFCSAPMSDAFFVLAQVSTASTPDALTCFLVPRVLEDGTRNVFNIQRLKDKLGNRSNASAEVEFEGTVGYLTGEIGAGVRTIIEMVARTRLDNVYGSAAGMRQAVAEALWHARNRRAFGALLIDQPAMTSVLADLALESEAATATALRLARAHDDDASDSEKSFRRLATAVAKYWVCKRGPQHAYEAMECMGGNGYVETFPLARRYREQPVMAIWEGSGNVIALDVLRAMARSPESVTAFFDEVMLGDGGNSVLDAHIAATTRLARKISAADSGAAQFQARRLVEDMALALESSLLVRRAPSAIADAFISARLGTDRRHEYGSLPAGTDFDAILVRH